MKRGTKIERAAQQWAVAREWLEKEIRLGHHEGMSLRATAKAAGVSHEQVRQIVAKTPG